MEWLHRTDVAAPPAAVWAVTVDLEGLPSVTPTMSEVERLDVGPLRIGSRVKVRQPAQPARVWTVVDLDEPWRFAWTTSVGGSLRMVATHAIEPHGTGTRTTLRLELLGRGSTVLGRVLGRSFAKALALENDGIRRAAEG
jgi:carbon monoxide dehydrogenase subunit G